MNIILVSDISRPCLKIETKIGNDGLHRPGKHCWTAVVFETAGKVDVYGFHFCIRLKVCDDEIWDFYNANVMLSPDKVANKYVLTYSNAKRVKKEFV